MNMKSSDSFHEALISLYRELIHEAMVESEMDHKTTLDISVLAHQFQQVRKAALLDGVSDHEIKELVNEALRFQKISLKVS